MREKKEDLSSSFTVLLVECSVDLTTSNGMAGSNYDIYTLDYFKLIRLKRLPSSLVWAMEQLLDLEVV